MTASQSAAKLYTVSQKTRHNDQIISYHRLRSAGNVSARKANAFYLSSLMILPFIWLNTRRQFSLAFSSRIEWKKNKIGRWSFKSALAISIGVVRVPKKQMPSRFEAGYHLFGRHERWRVLLERSSNCAIWLGSGLS